MTPGKVDTTLRLAAKELLATQTTLQSTDTHLGETRSRTGVSGDSTGHAGAMELPLSTDPSR